MVELEDDEAMAEQLEVSVRSLLICSMQLRFLRKSCDGARDVPADVAKSLMNGKMQYESVETEVEQSMSKLHDEYNFIGSVFDEDELKEAERMYEVMSRLKLVDEEIKATMDAHGVTDVSELTEKWDRETEAEREMLNKLEQLQKQNQLLRDFCGL